MASSAPNSARPLLPDDLEKIDDTINLYEGLLWSLQENEDLHQERILEITADLTRLHSWADYLRAKSSSSASMDYPAQDVKQEDPRPRSSASHISSSSSTGLSSSNKFREPRLPSQTDRKRPGNFLEAGLEGSDRKSKRSTPNPGCSAAPSPASSTDGSELDDGNPLLQTLFGDDWRAEHLQNKQYLKELEDRKKQEEADRAFAISLQRDIDVWGGFPNMPSSSSLGDSRQAIFGSSGGLIKPERMPPPPVSQVHVKQEDKHDYGGHHTSPLAVRTLSAASQPFNQPIPPFSAEPEFNFSQQAPGLHSRPGLVKTGSSTSTSESGSSRLPYSVQPNTDTHHNYLQPQNYHRTSIKAEPNFLPQPQYLPQQPPPIRFSSTEPGASGSTYSPILIDDSSSSDGDFQILSSSSAWPDNLGQSSFVTSTTRPSPGLYGRSALQGMPGSFPGASSIVSAGGNQVYGGFGLTSPSDLLNPAGGNNMPPHGQRTRINSPYNLDDGPQVNEADLTAILSNIRPDETVTPEDRMETPSELEIDLMPHQKLGLAWMVKAENSSSKGGVLADEMGLGKTIQAISLIIANKREVGTRQPRTTLIVAPVALMHQWEREIFDRVKKRHRLSVLILHGARKSITPRTFQHYDIVLTTYGLLGSEFKRLLRFQERQKIDPHARPDDKERCLLLSDETDFRRVILDEAQNIKNRRTKSALGACFVRSAYRWCLTGTPMQNSVDEFQSLLKFLKIAPYNSWEIFSKDISIPLKQPHVPTRDKAMQKLQAIIRATTLRRTKESKIDGQPILILPPKIVTESRADFSKDQEEFYKALETKTQLQFNRYLKAGTVHRHYSNILVLLLRLRQACCHPSLIKDFAISTGITNADELLENARELPREVIQRLKNIEAFECPVCMDAAENARITNPCGHPLCDECLTRLIETALGADEERGPVPCPSCRTKLNTTKTTDHRSFLKVHCPDSELTKELLRDEAANAAVNSTKDDSGGSSEDDDDDDESSESLKNFIVDDDVDVEFDGTESSEDIKPLKARLDAEEGKPVMSASKKRKRKSKGKGKAKDEHAHKSLADLRKAGLRSKAAKKAYLKRLGKDYEPSTKIEQTLSLLEEIHDQDPTDKTLIFSGFTTFLDLLEVPLMQHPKLQDYARYDGSMTAKDRTAAVEYFSDRPSCKVMLVSLKAGNAGLNLTKANHVVILDPHWNYYVEAQAIDRAHRLGQMKPVAVHRLLIKSEDKAKWPNGTVEDRILELQAKKRAVVESALNEEQSRSIGRLGVRELGYLFVSFSPRYDMIFC